MRAVLFCAAMTAAWLPAIASAQSIPLTESEALARLSAESPRARAARAGIEVARADVLSANRWPNPRLTYDREAVAGVTENIFMVAQPLPITGRRGLETQAASALLAATSSRADEELRRLRADLRLAFADLVAAQVRQDELAAAVDRLRGLADVLAKREAAGDAAGFDRLRAEREIVDVEADRALVASDRARAQAILASFFAETVDPARLVAMSAPAPAAGLPALETLVERAESTRGELLALRQEVTAADFSRQAADRRKIPEPELVGGSKSSDAAGGDIGSVFTIHASIPLFDRGQPERALAIARASQAEARSAALRAVIRGQIAALRATVLERRAIADRYRTQAVTGGEDIQRIAQVSYEAGERSILELLDAHRLASSARIRQAALDAAVRQAEIELEFASGWEIR